MHVWINATTDWGSGSHPDSLLLDDLTQWSGLVLWLVLAPTIILVEIQSSHRLTPAAFGVTLLWFSANVPYYVIYAGKLLLAYLPLYAAAICAARLRWDVIGRRLRHAIAVRGLADIVLNRQRAATSGPVTTRRAIEASVEWDDPKRFGRAAMATTATGTSPRTLRWMLVVSTLVLALGVAGAVGGLMLAALVVLIVRQCPDLSKRFWYSLAALPSLVHIWVLTLLAIHLVT